MTRAIHFEVVPKEAAGYILRVQERDEGKPTGTIGMLDPNSSDLKEKMDLIVQAWRIGRKGE